MRGCGVDFEKGGVELVAGGRLSARRTHRNAQNLEFMVVHAYQVTYTADSKTSFVGRPARS